MALTIAFPLILSIRSFPNFHMHRRRSGWNSGGTHDQGRRWIGAEWGRVCGGVSPLQPTRGSGGASWAPPAGSGAEPRPKTDFGVFWRPQNAHFCTNMTKSAGDNLHYRLPYSKFWGDVSPCPPVIYAHVHMTLAPATFSLTKRKWKRNYVNWTRHTSVKGNLNRCRTLAWTFLPRIWLCHYFI